MIVDTLEHLADYSAISPLLSEVVDFIKNHDLQCLEVGKHSIKGDEVFVNIAQTACKAENEAVFETHRKMIDIQLPLIGEETYGYRPAKELPEREYDETKDITKYPNVQAKSLIHCTPGEFAIFFPQDGHQPCIGHGEIRKAIFKVRV